MPFSGSGQATVTRQRAITGQTVLADQVNVPFDDVQAMLSQTFLRNGSAPATNDFNLNSFKVTNLADATNDGDAVSKSYLETAIGDLNANETVTNKSSNYTAIDTDYNALFRFTVDATLTNSDTSLLRDNWLCTVWADGGNVTVDPYLDNTINGQAQIIIQNQQKAIIYRTSSTTFLALIYDDSTAGPYIGGAILGMAQTATAGSNSVSVARGGAASDETVPHLMVLPSGITKLMNSGWVVGNGNGGLDTGTIGDGLYYVWVIQRSDTGVTDVLFSLSSTIPTMPASYTRKRMIGTVTRYNGVIQYGGSLAVPLKPTSANATDLPLGSFIAVQDSSPSSRGTQFTPFLKASNSGAYTANGGDSVGTLLGIYINCGLISATVCLAQRII